jgi:hypothetical protein
MVAFPPPDGLLNHRSIPLFLRRPLHRSISQPISSIKRREATNLY